MPKSAALDRLDGGASRRQRRPPARLVPDPAIDATPPRGLTPAARRIWMQSAGVLIADGRLRGEYREAFAARCEAWALYWRCGRALQRGLTQPLRKQGRIRRPEVEILRLAHELASRGDAKFGLTPADLQRLDVTLGAEAAHAASKTPHAPRAAGEPVDLDAFLRRRAERTADR